MKVYFDKTGFIKKYYEQQPDIIELPDGATLRDFCIRINETAEGKAGNAIWNSRDKKFRGPVVIFVDEKAVKDMQYELIDEQRIRLAYYIVGG